MSASITVRWGTTLESRVLSFSCFGHLQDLLYLDHERQAIPADKNPCQKRPFKFWIQLPFTPFVHCIMYTGLCLDIALYEAAFHVVSSHQNLLSCNIPSFFPCIVARSNANAFFAELICYYRTHRSKNDSTARHYGRGTGEIWQPWFRRKRN